MAIIPPAAPRRHAMTRLRLNPRTACLNRQRKIPLGARSPISEKLAPPGNPSAFPSKRRLRMPRLRTATMLLAGFVTFAGAAWAGPPEEKPNQHTDRYGDPLPEGAIARMGTLRFRYEKPISEIVFAPDGKTFAAAIRDGTICLCETTTGKKLLCFKQDQQEFTSPAYSGDGQRLAMLDKEAGLCVCDTASGKLHYRLGGSDQPISCYSFAPDGQTLATVESDDVIHLRSVATGQEVRCLRGHEGEIR